MPQLESFAEAAFDCFSADLQAAIAGAPLPSLKDGPRFDDLVTMLNGRDIGEHLGDANGRNRDECLSGLWLLAGDIDHSHTISQDIPSADGSFLHGIMHRREGDYGNAKYWFRRVGDHPVFDQIADETSRVSESAESIYSNPIDFVDACSNASRSGDHENECIAAQWIEWQCLMSYILSG